MELDRLNRLNELIAEGINPFNNSFEPNCSGTHGRLPFESNTQLGPGFPDFAQEYNNNCARYTNNKVAGRILQIHLKGGINFIQIERDGNLCQLIVQKANQNAYKLLKLLQIGDIIGAQGCFYLTERGVLSIKVNNLYLLTKSLQWIGKTLQDSNQINNTELLQRQRYVHMNIDRKVRDVYKAKAKIVGIIREKLDYDNFIEVNTRCLVHTNGGASAKPFVTHHNEIKQDMYLRIAPELDLKRLIVGGLDSIFEIGPNFRNEGIDSTHNPEFITLEAYKSYATYEYWMMWVDELLFQLTSIYEINIEIKIIDLRDICSISKDGKKNPKISDIDEFLEEEFKKEGKPAYIIKNLPAYDSPLAKPLNEDEKFCERFEVYVPGKNGYMEIINSYSENTDPIRQKEVFEKQMEGKSEEERAKIGYDEDFITALTYGLPPVAGLGLGIERALQWLLGLDSIKDVIAFPAYKKII